MLRRIDLRSLDTIPAGAIPRAELDVEAALDSVTGIVEDVRARGAQAVLEWGQRLDNVRPASLAVPPRVIEAALGDLDADIVAALQEAIRRTTLVHRAQMPEPVTTVVSPGGRVQQTWRPVARVGLYVPGGRAVYPSSVVMNVVPARVAGVHSMVVCSPPQPDNDGWPHPTVLAACALLGITEVYAAGGAQAVALMALGADLDEGRCQPVHLITGPGNIYVTAAKRLLRGTVGIDSEAGPTEIALIADDSAEPAYVAADLISQAEHDVVAASVLITDSEALVAAVEAQLTVQVAATKHGDRIATALTGQQSAAVLVDSMEQAVAVADLYAAEHLEIHTRNAADLAARVTNAGAIFVGPYAPVSLGDYLAGSNHVLPTGGCAYHSSGLNVHTFLRSVQVIDYDREALLYIADSVEVLARAEDLPAHAAAVAIRRVRR